MIARLPLRHALAALAALAVIALAGPAASQAPQEPAPPPPPAVSPAQLLLAKQIVDIKGVKAMFEPLVRGVVEKTKETVLQSNFIWAKDINEIAAGIAKDYEPRVSELVDATARYYAGHFTEAELKNILAFYQSPLGQKVLVEEPKALDESMAYAGAWGDNLSADVLNKMRVEMKKRGHDI
jgi:hypothetical protein